MSFSKDFLVLSSGSYDYKYGYRCVELEFVSVYHQQDKKHPYTFQQHIASNNYSSTNSSCVPSGDQQIVSHVKDILVVRGDNKTHFFVQDNGGHWEEALTLVDQSYTAYHVSGQKVLVLATPALNPVTKEEDVYYFELEDCTISPTKKPLSSTSPTKKPLSSTAPSASKRPTSAPSIWVTLHSILVGGIDAHIHPLRHLQVIIQAHVWFQQNL